MSIKNDPTILVDAEQDHRLSGINNRQSTSKKVGSFDPNLVKFQWTRDRQDSRDFL